MAGKIKIIISILAFAALIAVAAAAYRLLSAGYTPDIVASTPPSASPEGTPAEEDDESIIAPDFTITDIDGNEKKLSDFFGKPIVINFWASWCPPCKAELPDFDKLYGELGDDITFLMLDLVDGQSETVAKGSKYIEESGYVFPVYYDTSQEAAYTYGISSIPATLFIDSGGHIIAGHVGQMNEEMLRKGISLIYVQDDAETVSIQTS